MEKIRITMIGQKGVPAAVGGVERHVEELGARLAAGGFDVTAYARPWYVGRSAGRGERTHRGIRVIVLPTIRTKHLDAIAHTLIATIHAMRRVRPDVYHFHGVGPALCAILPRVFRPRARVLVTFHCVDRKHAKWGPLARVILTLGEWAACRFPHATIAVGETLTAYCAARYGRSPACIPNGIVAPPRVDPRAALAAFARWGLTPGQYLLTVARLVPHKEVHTVITAFRQLLRERPDLVGLQLAVVGEPAFTDTYADELRILAAGDPAIRFLGAKTNRALDALYANCLAFVHASRSEGLPFVLLEAAAAGAVPVVSDIPEHVEIITKVGGYTFQTRDVSDLAAKLEVLLASRDALPAIGQTIRCATLRQYHWDDVARATAGRYAHCIAHRPRRERPPRFLPRMAVIG